MDGTGGRELAVDSKTFFPRLPRQKKTKKADQKAMNRFSPETLKDENVTLD